MSISSTGLYGSATIVNTDIFDDVQTLKEEVRWARSQMTHRLENLLERSPLRNPEPIGANAEFRVARGGGIWL